MAGKCLRIFNARQFCYIYRALFTGDFKAFLKQHFLTSGLLTGLSKQSLSDSTQC